MTMSPTTTHSPSVPRARRGGMDDTGIDPRDVELTPRAVALTADLLATSGCLARAQHGLSEWAVARLAGSAGAAVPPGLHSAASAAAHGHRRWAQAIEERVRRLARAHPEAGFGVGEQLRWERDVEWARLGESFRRVPLGLTADRLAAGVVLGVAPVVEHLFLVELGRALRSADAQVDPLLLRSLALDAMHRRRWVARSVADLRGRDRPRHARLQEGLVAWGPTIEEILDAGSRVLGRAGSSSPAHIADLARSAHRDFLSAGSLRPPGPGR